MSTAAVETATRARTRAAIMRAAFDVLADDANAALGVVADAAGVARSTLHRYFPDREDLLTEMRAHVAAESRAAIVAARPEEGPALAALTRLCAEYFARWHLLTWSYVDAINSAPDQRAQDEPLDAELSALIGRGQADGTIDPALPDGFLQQLIWALLYATAAYVRQGGNRHESLTMALESLRRLASPAAPLAATVTPPFAPAPPPAGTPSFVQAVGTVLPPAVAGAVLPAMPLAAAQTGPNLTGGGDPGGHSRPEAEATRDAPGERGR